MEAGFSTASKKVREMGFGAGMGLPNIKKNTDELKIESVVGQGSTISFKIFY
jgi:anti-sigma regulatory factor (Ser/Thr protein kinase)